MPASFRRLAVTICLALLAVTGASRASAAEPAFPRSLGLYLQHSSLPSAETLARYDVVVIDNEWAHRDPAKIAAARALNPNIKFLAYTNLVDRPLSLGDYAGWRNRWDLWGYTGPNSLGTFPEQWIAKTASGSTVSEWSGTWMTNMSDTAPVVNGQRFYEYGANWVVDHIWASGVWDGLFLDVWGDRIWSSGASSWDVDRDGDDDQGSALYGAGSPWERGVTKAEEILRSRMGPNAILVANNTRTFRNGKIDGRLWESFIDPGKGRTFAWDAMDYVNGVNDTGHASPGMQLTLDKHFASSPGAADQKRARYFLTATLLSNGYWGGSVGDYEGFGWYEEFDGAGLGRGYLGQAVAAKPTWSQVSATFSTAAGVGRYANGLYRRDFANGIAIVNPTGSTQTLTLETSFRRLSGTSSVNTGGTVQTISIPAQDGIILLRDGGSVPTPAPPPAAVTVTVSPTSASLTTGGTRQFTASASDGGAIAWSVDGVAGGNATVGTITPGGLYTAPASVPSGGRVTVRATRSSGASAQATVTVTAPAPAPDPTPDPTPDPAPAPPPSSGIPAPSVSVPAGNLVANPRFASGLSGWGTWQGTASVTTADDGSNVALVQRSSGSAFTLDDSPATVASAVPGATYRAEAWVRAATPAAVGRSAFVWLRQTGSQDRRGSQVTLSSAWQRTTVELTAGSDGPADVRVSMEGVSGGEAMHVAMVSVVRADAVTEPAPAPEPEPTTAEPAPAPAPRSKAPTGRSPKKGTTSPTTKRSSGGVAAPTFRAPIMSAAGLRETQRTAQSAIVLIARLQARYRGLPEPTLTPARSSARIRLTARQLRINQRIVVAALRRVNALTAKLQGRPAPRPAGSRSRAVFRVTASQVRINRRIAVATLARARKLEVLMDRAEAAGRI